MKKFADYIQTRNNGYASTSSDHFRAFVEARDGDAIDENFFRNLGRGVGRVMGWFGGKQQTKSSTPITPAPTTAATAEPPAATPPVAPPKAKKPKRPLTPKELELADLYGVRRTPDPKIDPTTGLPRPKAQKPTDPMASVRGNFIPAMQQAIKNMGIQPALKGKIQFNVQPQPDGTAVIDITFNGPKPVANKFGINDGIKAAQWLQSLVASPKPPGSGP